MSDNITSDSNTNQGISLPASSTATHNIGLSPFFIEDAGRGSYSIEENTIMHRGRLGYFLTGTAYISRWQYILHINRDNHNAIQISPSYRAATAHSLSLRCLVSTKRQASE